ncbi:MAG TPA: CHC2 zinc finger domain-containing protein, partial [Candidatus Paceibacterota bacterium]|nr:CHC2 zinc finger domain-containing protein [Candidatus Paceibacterota bacterium]
KIKVNYLLSNYGVNTNINPTKCPLGHGSKGGKCLSYNDELWKCFHCDKGGDVFNLVMEKENCDFKQALTILKEKAGIKEEKKNNKRKKERKNKEEERIEQSLYIDEDIMAEQIYFEGKNLFCIYNKKTEEIKYEYNIGEITPINAEEINIKAIMLPSKAEEYKTEKELDKQIITFINKWLDIPKDDIKFALWNIKRSWVYEKFQTINYLRALGDTGQGKTRYLRTLGYLHYKPIMTSGATTTAPIFRIINKWKGTLIIDEGDIRQSDETDELIKIINLGFEQGQHLMRCDQNDAKKIDFFNPFCPKIIATRRNFKDKATESRCVTTVMKGTKRKDIPYELNQEFFEETQNIRNKLLMWRFRNYDKIITSKEELKGFENIEPRLKQIFNSYISLFNEEGDLERFVEFVKKKQEEIIDERRNSFSGEIISSIHRLIEKGIMNINSQDIITEGEIKDFKNQPIKPRGLNSTLKSLGFEKSVLKKVDGVVKRCIPLDDFHLISLFKRYGIGNAGNGCNDSNGSLENINIIEKSQKVTVGGLPHSTVTTVTTVTPIFKKLTDKILSECSICGGVDEPLSWEDDKGKFYCNNCKESSIGDDL